MKQIWLGAIIVWETLRYAVGAIFDEGPDSKRKAESGKQKTEK